MLLCGGFFGGGVETGGGGQGGGGQNPVDSCDRFDPVVNTFTAPSFMNTARYAHSAVLLQNGQAMLCGGYGFGQMTSCERFDAATNSFFLTGFMTTQRAHFTMTTMLDGRVLACGGEAFGLPLNTCEVYNPAIGTWTPTAPMSTTRTNHTASLLPDGKVVVVGGMDDLFAYLASAESFDPTTNTWVAEPAITDARAHHDATTLATGSILVNGGFDINGAVNSSMVFAVTGANGSPCLMPTDCGSGNCIEGVCCNDTCVGECVSCIGANTNGADGVCNPIAPNTDPDNECDPELPATCGRTGECNGKGACAVVASGVNCVDGGCTDSTLNYNDVCDGLGSCIDGGVVECDNFACNEEGCNTACVSSADCATTAYCDVPNSNCVPKKPDGQPTLDPDQCLSGSAADDVCCDVACDLGVCDACSVSAGADADGVCMPVGGSCDDDNPCTVDACDPTSGCGTTLKLDNTPCPGGACFGGQCVPDASNSAGSGVISGGSTGTTNPNGGTGASDPGNNAGIDGVPALEGNGICTASGVKPQRLPNGWLAVLGLSAIGLVRRRRRH